MAKNWAIAEYHKDFEPGIIKLFNDVFHKGRTQGFLEWENRKNPAGQSIIKLAVDHDEVVGHACLWLFRVKLFEQQALAGQGVDGMVHPDYRKQGMYEELAFQSFEAARQQGVGVSFRFPNISALSAISSRLNVSKVCNVPQYLKILKGKDAAEMFSGNPVVSMGLGMAFDVYRLLRGRLSIKNAAYGVEEITRFGQEFDTLWQRESQLYQIAVQRDAAFLNWRYKDSPIHYQCFAAYKQGRLAGYIVGAVEEKQSKAGKIIKLGHIADIFCSTEDKEAIKLLLKEFEKYMELQGVSALSCWMLKHWFYSKELEKAGYVNLKSPSILAAGMIGDAYKGLADQLLKEENWFVTIGDSDYI